MSLFINTEFSKALINMFEKLDKVLALEQSGDVSNPLVQVCVFGGCAVHLYTGSRTTNDVDATVTGVLKDANKIKSVYFRNEKGRRQTLMFDKNYNTTLAPLDPAYEDRLNFLHKTNSGIIQLNLVSAVDIAVTKLGRFGSDDIKDIKKLYKQGLFTIEEFLEVAEEGLNYCAVAPDKLKLTIVQAENILREESR